MRQATAATMKKNNPKTHETIFQPLLCFKLVLLGYIYREIQYLNSNYFS